MPPIAIASRTPESQGPNCEEETEHDQGPHPDGPPGDYGFATNVLRGSQERRKMVLWYLPEAEDLAGDLVSHASHT